MKRIAIIADPMDNQQAGVHIYTKNMVYSLLQNNTENYYFIYKEKNDPLLDLYSNCKQVIIPNFIGFTAIRKFIILPFLSVFYGANIVIESAHFGPFLMPQKIKRITVIHDLSAVLFPQWHSFYSSTLQKIFLNRILKKASLIISNSLFTEKEIIKNYPFTKDKIQTIYPGVISDTIQEGKENDNKKIPYFLFVGTIEPRKNLNLLLNAFKEYKNQIKDDKQLLIVGAKGWKTDSFFEIYNQHPYKNDIIITGFVTDEELKKYYKNCYAFIYPSQYEGFGFPVIEAMRQGTVCVTTADSSMSEIAYPFVITFQNNNLESLFKVMCQIENFKNVTRSDEIIIHSQKYDWDIFAKAFIKKINNL
jgi:glycosyltransferase involved in cell wall biosynthesis